MPRGRESGLVVLSSLHNLLVLWFIYEQCYLILDFALCCYIMPYFVRLCLQHVVTFHYECNIILNIMTTNNENNYIIKSPIL